MIGERISPAEVPARLRDLSAGVRVAVLLDAAGSTLGCSDPDEERERTLGELVRDLLETVDDSVAEPPSELEGQVEGGAVFIARNHHFTLAAVTRRTALSSLTLYDLRALLASVDAA